MTWIQADLVVIDGVIISSLERNGREGTLRISRIN